jgi:HSP20 family molecular chaperone IbpA
MNAVSDLSDALQSLVQRDDDEQLTRKLREVCGEVKRLAQEVWDADDVTGMAPDDEERESDMEIVPGCISPSVSNGEEAVYTTSDSTEADAEAEDELPERTDSQNAKKRRVDAITDIVNERRDPVGQLRTTLSKLEKSSSDDEKTVLNSVQAAADELKQVEKLQQSFRDFGEDLMEGMIALDHLTGLAEQDRHARKATLRSIQDLLDEIDNAKPRVQKLRQHLAAEVDRLKPPPESELQTLPTSPQAVKAALGQRHNTDDDASHSVPPPLRPAVDWSRIQLPAVRFESDQIQVSSSPSSTCPSRTAYLLSALLPQLDPSTLKVEQKGNSLLIQGVCVPPAATQKAIDAIIDEQIRSFPRAMQQRMSMREDVDALAARLGEGQFGSFKKVFELPEDVDEQGIEYSHDCEGVLRLVLRRRGRQAYPMPSMRRPNARGFRSVFDDWRFQW